MGKEPKTIEIFLRDGTLTGVKTISLMGRDIKGFSVPRDKLSNFFQEGELSKPVIYFLFAIEPKENGLFQVYIGKTTNFVNRVNFHRNINNKKEFWDIVIAFSGEGIDLDYLERKCIELAKNQRRCILENRADRTEGFILEAHRARMDEFLSYIGILLHTLGYPIFSTTQGLKENKKFEKATNDILICKGRGAEAKGKMTDDGFVVLKNSTATEGVAKLPSYNKLKEFLEKEKVLKPLSKKKGLLEFTSDYTFKSPSAASNVILGFANNGRKFWKNTEGKTLAQIENIS